MRKTFIRKKSSDKCLSEDLSLDKFLLEIISSENYIVTNYKEFAEKVITKYPYTEVDGPKIHEVKKVEIVPDWIKNSAGWWAEDKITDVEFTTALQFLIQNEIIKMQRQS